MSTRAVLVAALITGLLLGIAGTRTDSSTDPRPHGSLTVSGH
ncbi:hypothetical protein [Streptomyces sp. NPDC058308]